MVEEKKDPPEAITVEFRVSMHCKACERSVVRALSKVKGVETITIDMNNHKAIATGQIKPEKALKKLKKKTGKRVEIVLKDEDSKGSASNTEGDNAEPDLNVESAPLMLDDLEQCMLLTMFNDENPNACYVM
ncbi:heavy metal-associated isoprenylated plant protein 26 [Cinnamomum micranthum f. kanehirae]|uniref:Heavy metal-associated isoprenylated plant protein 26 n=1 Tax=Cinnamomum micranthum f. kanehirae TaxID=337451 RepID=A0A3S3MU60_9MAGN|nr:heavy metal-associated isoprenylated plant protein 26 [Cinnamomum micranthum f. kanehirae]